MKRLLLARFDRALHEDPKYANEFSEAYEKFLGRVRQFQVDTGMEFEVEIFSAYHKAHDCDVTHVYAVFSDETVLAQYRLSMEKVVIATAVDPEESGWEFGNWREISWEKGLEYNTQTYWDMRQNQLKQRSDIHRSHFELSY